MFLQKKSLNLIVCFLLGMLLLFHGFLTYAGAHSDDDNGMAQENATQYFGPPFLPGDIEMDSPSIALFADILLELTSSRYATHTIFPFFLRRIQIPDYRRHPRTFSRKLQEIDNLSRQSRVYEGETPLSQRWLQYLQQFYPNIFLGRPVKPSAEQERVFYFWLNYILFTPNAYELGIRSYESNYIDLLPLPPKPVDFLYRLDPASLINLYLYDPDLFLALWKKIQPELPKSKWARHAIRARRIQDRLNRIKEMRKKTTALQARKRWVGSVLRQRCKELFERIQQQNLP